MSRILFWVFLAWFWSLVGCGIFEPATRFSYGAFGFSFSDTKNNDVRITGFKRSADTLEFEELTVRNNSSDVMTANVQQMIALNEQFRIHGENIRSALSELKSFIPIAGMFSTGASVSTPFGGANVSNAGLEALAKALAPLVKKELATTQPQE